MITFSLQAQNSNFYSGHKPSNSNCWDDEAHALVLSIEQARAIASAWPGYMRIVISVKSKPMSDEAFDRELFCAGGGDWWDWPYRSALERMRACSHHNQTKIKCAGCGAQRISPSDYWYEPGSGKTL